MLPSQRIALRNKTKQWYRDTIDHFEALSYGQGAANRSSNYNKKINYDLFNGIFNKKDVEYVCNPLGLENNEFPASFQHYDAVSPAFNLLIGEEAKRGDNCIVVSQSPNDINRKQGALKQRIVELLQQELMQDIDPSTIDPNEPLPTPEQILKYDKHNVSDLIESKSNKMLKHLRKHLNTKEKFKKGWKDAIIAGEEIYWAGVGNKEVDFRRCNPLNIYVLLDGDTDYIDDALAVVETRILSIATILDELGDELDPSDLKELEDRASAYRGRYGNNNPTFITDKSGNIVDTGVGSAYSGNTAGSDHQDMLTVVRVEWKGYKKLFHLTYTDEQYIPQDMIVDETFKLDIFKEVYPDATAEEFWVTEAHEGIKVGDDIYLACRAKPNQRRRMDNPYYCKLGYIGLIYNATNSTSTSLMDRVKPYQYLYNIFMYRLELAFAQDQGKKFVMDLAQVPRSEGMDIERWMYYMKALGIIFVNSHEESRKGSHIGRLPTFNQFTEVDLSMANTIQQYITTLDYIKQQIAFISGVTPQRLGAIENRELVGNVERSVQQSALITEYLFDAHDEVKRRVYTALIECAKIAYKDGKKIQFVLDDMGIELLNIEEMEFEDSEFNVYMSNSSKDMQVLETLKQLSQVALQHDKATLSTIIDTIINDNPRDIIRILQRSEEEAMQRAQQAQQQEQAIEQQKNDIEKQRLEQEIADKQADRELEQYKIDADNQTKIMVAEISALSGKDGPSDMDGNGIPDPIEVANVNLYQREIASKEFMEREKIKSEKERHEKEISAKQKEIDMKKTIEEQKIKAIDVQNKSQEKIQKEQMANDDKQRRSDEEIERKRLAAEKEMHEKELKIKEKELKLKEKETSAKERIEQIKLKIAEQKAKADEAKHKMDMQAQKEKVKVDKQKAQIDIQKKKQAAKKAATPKKPKK